MGRLNCTNISVALCVLYVAHSFYTFYYVYNIQQCDFIKVDSCISSYLIGQEEVQLTLYGSKKISDARKDLLLQDTVNPFEPWTRVINVSLPLSTRRNGSYFLHMHITPIGKQGNEWTTTATVPITRYAPPRVKAFNLMGNDTKDRKETDSTQDSESPITHFTSRVVISMMTEDISLDRRAVPGELYRYLKVAPGPPRSFLPMAYIDELGFRAKDLVEVTIESNSLELNIDYKPMSAGKLKLWETLKQSINALEAYGFGDKEIDEVKGIFADTNFYMLLLTIVVSAFHLLFDFLAFKNDISYWKKRKTMVGLSTRVVIWRTVSTIIIFVYLHDQNTSLLVLVPAGISSAIEVWKLKKALKVSLVWSGWMPKLQLGEISDKERETGEFDATAMYYLNFILYPLLVIGAIYSLIYTPHKSWYSWCIQSLVNGVYAFGFIFMLPQLFVNYKLKSVAHLPWRAFMYKAFNTFIDDIFAFIITMPTAHRVACFRDDIVFIIYLYQRWLYPVDKTRTNEYGQTFDEDSDDKKER